METEKKININTNTDNNNNEPELPAGLQPVLLSEYWIYARSEANIRSCLLKNLYTHGHRNYKRGIDALEVYFASCGALAGGLALRSLHVSGKGDILICTMLIISLVRFAYKFVTPGPMLLFFPGYCGFLWALIHGKLWSLDILPQSWWGVVLIAFVSLLIPGPLLIWLIHAMSRDLAKAMQWMRWAMKNDVVQHHPNVKHVMALDQTIPTPMAGPKAAEINWELHKKYPDARGFKAS